jgi:hypothetical protein
MNRILFTLAVGLLFSCSLPAQQSSAPAPAAQQQPAPKPAEVDLNAQVPAPKPEDVKSIDAILTALYNVISGPAGERDWNRFRSLFLPVARLTANSIDAQGKIHPRLRSVEDYVKGGGAYFMTHPFYESPIANRVEQFGNVAQVFSSYESRNAPGGEPFARGINSIQLLYDGNRWWVVSILWDEERSGNPLPKDLAPHPAASNK